MALLVSNFIHLQATGARKRRVSGTQRAVLLSPIGKVLAVTA